MIIPKVDGDVGKLANSQIAADDLKWKTLWQYIFRDKMFLNPVISYFWKFILKKQSKDENDSLCTYVYRRVTYDRKWESVQMFTNHKMAN